MNGKKIKLFLFADGAIDYVGKKKQEPTKQSKTTIKKNTQSNTTTKPLDANRVLQSRMIQDRHKKGKK